MDDTNYKEHRAQKYARTLKKLNIHGLGGQAIKQIAEAFAGEDFDACNEILNELASMKQEAYRIRQFTAHEILSELYHKEEAIDKSDICRLALQYNVIFDEEQE